MDSTTPTPIPLTEPTEATTSSGAASLYAVQCGKCFKWRVILTTAEYESIRENFTEDPWFCDKKPNKSCSDPADIEYDSSRLWAIDKPNIPKTPPNTKKELILRTDFSKFDVYYILPNGKKMRSITDVEKFLQTYPEYKDQLSLSDFSFASPKIMKDMIPIKYLGRVLSGGNKKIRKE